MSQTSNKFNFTFQELLDELKKVANSNPEQIYEPLPDKHYSYVSGNCDGCLFGHALQNLGVSKEYLSAYEDIRICAIEDYTIYNLLSTNTDFSKEELNYLLNIQKKQDQGCTWREAINEQFSYVRSTR